jgi:Ca2+/Na+ antiporter
MITHFNSIKEYFSFVGAREFWDRETKQVFAPPKSRLETVGEWVAAPILKTTDFAFRNIKNPLFILALTVAALAAATILFYPTQVVAAIALVMPPLLLITPAMLKFGLYLGIQTTLIGLFLRTWGRLAPDGELMQAWNTRLPDGARRLEPIPLGANLTKIF